MNNNQLENLEQVSVEPQSVLLGQDIMKLCPAGLMNSINKKERVEALDTRKLISNIAEHMIYVLKDTSRGTAVKIVTFIIDRTSKALEDRVGNIVLGSGVDTLTARVLNAIQYRLSLNRDKRVKQKRVHPEDNGLERTESDVCRRKDEYGCASYSPILPEGETSETLEKMREDLCEEWEKVEETDGIQLLMLIKKTYAAQRAEINVRQRDLQTIFQRWPFFKDPYFMNAHIDILMGEKILQIWINSHMKMAEDVRKFFKFQNENSKFNQKQTSSNAAKKKKEKMDKILDEAELMTDVVKSNMPNNIVMFPLLAAHFQENQDLLFQVFDVS